MQKAISAIFYVALRPSLCCRLIVSGLLYEAKHALAKLLLLRAEVDTLGTVHFEYGFILTYFQCENLLFTC